MDSPRRPASKATGGPLPPRGPICLDACILERSYPKIPGQAIGEATETFETDMEIRNAILVDGC